MVQKKGKMIDKNEKVEGSPTKLEEQAQSQRWWHRIKEPAFLEPLFCWFEHHDKQFEPYIRKGQVVADLGCGWGHYTFLLSAKVGPAGKVYAVDLLDKCIQKIRRRAEKKGFKNIEAVTASVEDLRFIKDRSVDFVLSNGLLCSMKGDRRAVVSEIERILKQDGVAYITLGASPPLGLVGEAEWNVILSRFSLVAGGPFKDLWAAVKVKPAVF
jgi:SAM-dependent methyltransferase